MKAMLCGSFDPVTRGHADLITRAAALFDGLEVVILENSEKTYTFPCELRLAWLRRVCEGLPGVRVAASSGTAAAYAVSMGADCFVKGVRNATDLSYEQDMAALNRLAGGPETLLLPTDPALAYVSSSAVREFLSRGLPAEELLPTAVAADILAAYQKIK